MFEESVSSLPSIWASMNSWLTPTVLFLLLQLMIGTIFIASSLGTQKHHDHDHDHHQQQQQQQGLARSPSVLQRFKSINFYAYRSPEPATNYEKPPESETHFAFPHAQEVEQPKLPRSPSILERLQSFKSQFHFPKESSPLQPRDFAVPEPHFSTYEHSHEDEDDEESEEEAGEAEELDEDQFEAEEEGEEKEQTLDEIYSQLDLQDHHVSRTTSDTKPASGDVPAKLPKKMKKSASAKSAFAHFEADDIVESRRPATVKEKKAKAAEDDAEVDSKADDFINRFKQQLKLQRLDSIIRYKDMVYRGSDK
ncbi:pathogen-associated molecular patterns-induced protein A70 [Rosa rugosa]|uniref:pathogen-associated molecular patterns-induced protein A70 n=1 Tax=Rosa rugosa TaxID=74645 RepID=UPI002B400DD1|nr:pathogen-associated molecular patterns-induced protein A70 [Rosa rugosa]